VESNHAVANCGSEFIREKVGTVDTSSVDHITAIANEFAPTIIIRSVLFFL
jgi:hypothetical protein